jgi:hypothetical protein
LRRDLLLAVAAVAAFGAGLRSSFHLDDYSILSNPVLTSSEGWWRVWGIAQTRPLTYFTFWFDYQIWGENPAGYHLLSLVLHVAAVLLLARVLPDTLSTFGAALFAVHPLQAEAVLYVFARASVLMTVFCLLSWSSWRRGRVWWAVGWFAVALLAKEECVAFPLFLWLLARTEDSGPRQPKALFTMLALAVLTGVRVAWVASTTAGSGAGMQAGISPVEYLAAQGYVVLRYLQLLVVPVGFSFDPQVHRLVWGWLIVAAIVVLAWRLRLYWVLGGLLLLLPTSSILPAADLSADRRMYLPMIAFAPALALVLRRLALPAVVALLVLSIARTQVWSTEQSLWTEAHAKAPSHIRPRIHLARASEPQRAIDLLVGAKEIAPEDPQVASELGRAYLAFGRPDLALAEFGRVLALQPGDAKALNNRGAALLGLGQVEAARSDFEAAIRADTCLVNAYENLRRTGRDAPLPPECPRPR